MNTNIPLVEANCGEHIYDFLKRVLQEARDDLHCNGLVAKHNDIEVVVYQSSCLHDICDKYDMQVKIIRLEYKLKETK